VVYDEVTSKQRIVWKLYCISNDEHDRFKKNKEFFDSNGNFTGWMIKYQ
jgi:hypothetical protein